MSNQINLKELSVAVKPTFRVGYIAKSKDGDVEVERIEDDSVYLRMAGKLVISNKYDVDSMGLKWERKAQYAIPGIQMTEEDVEVKQKLAEDLRKLIDEYEIIGLDKYDIVEAIEKMINGRIATAKAKIQPVDLVDKNKLDALVTEKIGEIIDKIRSTEINEEDVAGMIFNLLNELGRWGIQEIKGEEKKTAMLREAPGHGVVNEDLWDKAKKAADKSYNKSSESDKYWGTVSTIYKNMGGKYKKKADRSISISYLQDCIDKNNKEYGTAFEIAQVGGYYELWDSRQSSRIDVGSKKDIYNAFVKVRFEDKYRSKEQENLPSSNMIAPEDRKAGLGLSDADEFNSIAAITIYNFADLMYEKQAKVAFKKLKAVGHPAVKDMEDLDDKAIDGVYYNNLVEEYAEEHIPSFTPTHDYWGAKCFVPYTYSSSHAPKGGTVLAGDSQGMFAYYDDYATLIKAMDEAESSLEEPQYG